MTDRLLLAGGLVLGRHVQDAVGVDVEGDLDLRHAARRRRDVGEVEAAQRLVVPACSRSPCSTCTVTAVWLSSAVEKTCDFLVGIVVFFSISLVMTPPRVSMPSDSGVTSSSSTSLTSPPSTPPWMAAPMATASSGLTSLRGSLPKKSFDLLLHLRHAGLTADQDHLVDLAGADSRRPSARSCTARWCAHQVVDQRLELGRVSLTFRCFGPVCIGGDVRQVDVGLLASWTARSWPSRRPPSGAAGPADRCAGRCPAPS
jgi:hypothetical protein